MSLKQIWRHCNVWCHRALNRNDLEWQRRQHKIGLAVAWHFFSLLSDFPTRGSGTCDFMRALTSTSVNFSFAVCKGKGKTKYKLYPRLHDKANIKQTSNRHHANVCNTHRCTACALIALCLLYVCFVQAMLHASLIFASCLLHRVNGVLGLYLRLRNVLFLQMQ